MSETGKVIEFCPNYERWLIYVSPDVKEEKAEYSGDNAITVYAKSLERVVALVKKGRSLLARSAAGRRQNCGQGY